MKKIKIFTLNISVYGVFCSIKHYLMSKYVVYTAIFRNNYAYFRIGYAI